MSAHLDSDELLERLVAFETTSRLSNRPLIDFICDYLDRPGVSIERSDDDGKINLVARCGPQTEGRQGLVLCGHTDTVPADEPEWTYEPFALSAAQGNWYGRGTSDMKGFLSLAIDRLARLRAAEVNAPLALLFTCDEEIGSLGAQRFVEDPDRVRALPENVLIGEPTRLRAIRLHKGHLRGHITFRGVAAHSGYPHRGVNAIAAAGKALVALDELQHELVRQPPVGAGLFSEVPFEVLNPAIVRGGGAINVVPDHCRVDFGIRLLPGSDEGALIDRTTAALAALDLAADWTVEVDNVSPALETAAEALLYRELTDLLGQHDTPAVAFSSDAGVLSRHGCQCVLFGPGSIEVAHKPDEYVPVAELAAAGDVLDRLIHRLCREAS